MSLKRKRMDVEGNEAPSRGLRLLHSAGRTGVIEARAEKPHRSSLSIPLPFVLRAPLHL